jgi:hypothetical protein
LVVAVLKEVFVMDRRSRFPRSAGVYCLEHVPSGRVYIGQSSDFSKRLLDHWRRFRRGVHDLACLGPFVRRGCLSEWRIFVVFDMPGSSEVDRRLVESFVMLFAVACGRDLFNRSLGFDPDRCLIDSFVARTGLSYSGVVGRLKKVRSLGFSDELVCCDLFFSPRLSLEPGRSLSAGPFSVGAVAACVVRSLEVSGHG